MFNRDCLGQASLFGATTAPLARQDNFDGRMSRCQLCRYLHKVIIIDLASATCGCLLMASVMFQ